MRVMKPYVASSDGVTSEFCSHLAHRSLASMWICAQAPVLAPVPGPGACLDQLPSASHNALESAACGGSHRGGLFNFGGHAGNGASQQRTNVHLWIRVGLLTRIP